MLIGLGPHLQIEQDIIGNHFIDNFFFFFVQSYFILPWVSKPSKLIACEINLPIAPWEKLNKMLIYGINIRKSKDDMLNNSLEDLKPPCISLFKKARKKEF